MGRKLRIEFEGSIHHVYARGNEGKRIFRRDSDCRVFLNLVKEANDKFNWNCLGYNLMRNHFHLQVQNVSGKLSKGMHWLNLKFAKYFNRTYDLFGHVFQGRFGDSLVQNGSHSNTLSRYIALNPVRKEWVSDPTEWEWSSHAAILGLKEPHSCLDVNGALSEFGENNIEAARNYKEFVDAGIGQPVPDMYAPIIGERQFIREQIEGIEDPSLLKLVRPSLEEIFAVLNIEDEDYLYRRNTVIKDTIKFYHYRQTEVADYLGMSGAQISRLAKQ